MNNVEKVIAAGSGKQLAILLDPDKTGLEEVPSVVERIHQLEASMIFVGGSTVEKGVTQTFVQALKKHGNLPIVIFPGDCEQISGEANALLFLSLLSGENPEFLIGQQVRAVKKLRNSSLEIIPTGYILIDGGTSTSVAQVSATKPMDPGQIEKIVDVALAGKYLGKRLLYLEAGSGAKNPVPIEVISRVKEATQLPLIVGGGLRSEQQIAEAINHGADLVVVGTAFEENQIISNKKIKNEHIC